MYTTISVLILALTVLKLQKDYLAFQAKVLELKARKLEARMTKSAPVLEPLPAKLAAYAASQSEEWAREQTIASMYELYGKYGSWDLVEREVARTAFA